MGVGFEFATGWDIYKFKAGVALPARGIVSASQLPAFTDPYPKAAVVRGGLGWQMTVDGTEIEYVTSDVPESAAGENQLVGIVGDLTRFVSMMNKRNMQEFLTVKDFPDGTFPPANRDFIIHIKKDLRMKEIEAIPQVSGGVRLARIRKLWRLLADPKSIAAKRFFSETNGGVPIYSPMISKPTLPWKRIKDTNWPDHKPSAALRGLVTLIATYLQRGYSPTGASVGAVKYLFFIMSRTNFSALFNQLPMAEQRHYRRHKDQWVSFICKDIMSQVLTLPAGLDANGSLIERRIIDRGKLNPGKILPITRKDWLKGIVEGRDVLSAHEHPLGGADNAEWQDADANLGHRLRGLAGLGDKMDSLTYKGRENKAVILEFRARQAVLKYSNWTTYCLEMHKFFTQINEGDRDGMIDIDASVLS